MNKVLAILILILLLALYGSIGSQTVQEFPVNDFSGGLVNSVTNNLMQPNQAIVLSNYDVDEYGALKRRPGFGSAYSGSRSLLLGVSAFPYYGIDAKSFLTIRRDRSQYSFGLPDQYYADQVGSYLASLYKCTDGGSCTTVVPGVFHYYGNRLSYPFNLATFNINDNQVIAETQNELLVYDGTTTFNARPYIKGQPRAEPLDGIGSITGIVEYRYIYSNTHCPAPSTPSYPIYVNEGNVWVHGIIDAQGNDTVRVYRRDNMRGNFHLVDSFVNDTMFVDSLSMTAAAAMAGLNWDMLPYFTRPYSSTVPGQYDSAAPGGIVVTIDSSKAPDSTIAAHGLAIPPNHELDTCYSGVLDSGALYYAWAVMFQDSAGRYSYMTTPTIKRIAVMGDNYRLRYDTTRYRAVITHIPTVPSIDSAAVKKKWLIRACYDFSERYLIEPQKPKDTTGWTWEDVEKCHGQFYKIAEIPLATTTFTDSISPLTTLTEWFSPPDSFYLDSMKDYCIGDSLASRLVGWADARILNIIDDTMFNVITRYSNDDSAIMFRPTELALHGQRLYAVGNPRAKNALYFSDYGRPTCWPNDKYINLPSQGGDWINGLISMGDWLAIFRQNSVMGLSGLSFYQYNVTTLSEKIGLTAPQSLASGMRRAFFAHTTGVYQLGGNNWETPISYSIQNSFDSAGGFLRCAWGAVVGNEYWISIPISPDSLNSKTYIYNIEPKPHWKSYSRGFLAGAPYDYSGSSAEYNTKRWLLMTSFRPTEAGLSDHDSLLSWGYAADTLDGGSRITSVYQSPYFFADANREKILYVDVMGTGKADSLTITLYDKNGQSIVDTIKATVDFTKNRRHRFACDEIVENLSVRITDKGYGQNTITGYVIGYIPWDKGKNR